MIKMRSEQEMLELILGFAAADERVRAVFMNGSRANPNVKKDIYRDYDIVYVVTETQSFLDNKGWISVFGETAMLQEPDSNDLGWGIDCDFTRSYCWLMLFKDGNRIDLSIKTKEPALEAYLSDSLCVKLLDKDGILPEISASNDRAYWIKPPAKSQYDGCCNEFWWCLNNVAKGIARSQLPYAHRMYSQVVHMELERMAQWYIGTMHNFSVSSGMWGKYFKELLPESIYAQFMKTYCTASAESLWDAVFAACDLFEVLARSVAGSLGYSYNEQDGKNMVDYLKSIMQHRFTV